ncbi:MAG: Flp pilus assembly protein CpaB [Caulobacteraceae bacterium]
MNPARIAIVVVAFVAAMGLALFVHGMFARPKAPAPIIAAAPAPATTRVLVAKVDLAVGARLSAQNMTWAGWPVSALNAAYITDGETAATPQGVAAKAIDKAGKAVTDMADGGGSKMQSMVGDIVRDPIFAGEPIVAKKIVHAGDSSYMAVRLPPGTVAIALPISADSGAGGFIEPGDRVDVLSTHNDTARTGQGGMVTETVLSNALVLAIDQHTDAPKDNPALVGVTVTLEVPDASAGAVAKARSQGGLTLALRSYADIGGESSGQEAGDGHTVRVFRGGAPELVSVQ